MALSFPLARADFLDLLPVQDLRLAPIAQTVATGLAGGDILTAEVAPALWQGSVDLAPMPARQAEAVAVLLNCLEVPGRAFFVYRKTQIGPAADPLGAVLGAASVLVDAVDFDAAEITLSGLPAGYQITAGDHLAFEYGGAPVRYGLHRAAEAATADAGGVAGPFALAPYIRAGLVVGAAVALVRPSCKAVLVPGSVDYGTTRNGKTGGMGFAFRQTLR